MAIPSPHTWTLRFKNNRTTILLHVNPLQTLGSVRAELLQAVRDTNPGGDFNGMQIPQSADDVRLARATDVNDLGKGWVALDKSDWEDLDAEIMDGKGKAKVGLTNTRTGKGKGTKNAGLDSPQGAGLRDNDIVAFKFRVVDAEEDGMEKVELEGDEALVVEPMEEWDVVVPTLEETYGDEDEDEIAHDVNMR